MLGKDYDRAVEVREWAYSVHPNSTDSNALMAWTLSLVGKQEKDLSY
jgi:hypothetical protein